MNDGKRLADSSDKLEPDTVKVVSTGSNGAGGPQGPPGYQEKEGSRENPSSTGRVKLPPWA